MNVASTGASKAEWKLSETPAVGHSPGENVEERYIFTMVFGTKEVGVSNSMNFRCRKRYPKLTSNGREREMRKLEKRLNKNRLQREIGDRDDVKEPLMPDPASSTKKSCVFGRGLTQRTWGWSENLGLWRRIALPVHRIQALQRIARQRREGQKGQVLCCIPES